MPGLWVRASPGARLFFGLCYRVMLKYFLPDRESNPGLPRDRRRSSPLDYRGHDILQFKFFGAECKFKKVKINFPKLASCVSLKYLPQYGRPCPTYCLHNIWNPVCVHISVWESTAGQWLAEPSILFQGHTRVTHVGRALQLGISLY